MVSTAYVAHVLMASGTGKVASAQNIARYFVLVAALGIPNYGIKEIAKIYEGRKKTQDLFSELFIINAISTLLCVIGYYSMIEHVLFFRKEIALYRIVGIGIMLNFINVDWFFQGNEEYKYIAERSFLVKSLSLIAIFIFVRDKSDYNIYAFITVLATGGNYFFNIIHLLKRKIYINFRKINIKRHIKIVAVLLCTSIAIELYTMVDTTMLTLWCSDENVGYYTSAIRIVKIIISLITSICGVLLPRLSYYKKTDQLKKCDDIVNKMFKILIFLLSPCGMGLIMVSTDLIPLFFGTSFTPAIKTISIASLLIYTLGFSNLFGTQVLLTFDGEKKLFICTLIGAVTNIALNLCMIPIIAENGAALASVISEGIVTLATFLFSKKYIHYDIEFKDIGVPAVSTIIMIVIIALIKYVMRTGIIRMIVMVSVGGVVYLCFNIVLSNGILNEVINEVKQKIQGNNNNS